MGHVKVLRLCSVFEAPRGAVRGRAARFDPIGGMQSHVGSLSRALDELGVEQRIVTTRPPGAPRLEHLGARATVHRVGLPVPQLRQGYGA
jgi:glycogen(starch) synthase